MTAHMESLNLTEPDGQTKLWHCVVGSGPAGVACAHALLQQGVAVRLLDGGVSLEADRAEIVRQMSQTTPSSWTALQLGRLKEGTDASAKGIPLKRVFGSDFPYRDCEEHVPADFQSVGLRASLALGGLSNVWGAAMMPYSDRDLAGWPFGTAQLAEHYAAVLQFTGLSARHDDLEEFFPLYREQTPPLEPSRQATILFEKMRRHRGPLSQAGIHFGQARLTVHAAQPEQKPGCVYCGLCMYGCPYGYIYNCATTLAQLQVNRQFRYEPNLIVTKVSEAPTHVRIEGYRRLDRRPFAMETPRVYLAAGVIPTTRILLSSMDCYNQPVQMKDSQYFLLPLVLSKSAKGVQHESLHTLCQAFVEMFDSTISPHTVHLQIYSYNDLIAQAIAKAMGPLAGPLSFLRHAMESRLLIVQGYLHSDQSSGIEVILTKTSERDRMQLRARANPQTRPAIRRIVRKLIRHSRHLGAIPLPPMLQVAEAGRGFHSGGTFPMRTNPAPLESDIWGRPAGWRRVHAVDATVLPSIPATTITFSVMANAHRIASHAAALE